jgi:hypothetical protein
MGLTKGAGFVAPLLKKTTLREALQAAKHPAFAVDTSGLLHRHLPMLRVLRWFGFINRQRSAHKLLNLIQRFYGPRARSFLLTAATPAAATTCLAGHPAKGWA